MRWAFAYSVVVLFIGHGVVYPALLRVPDDYATIQAALGAAATGDTVEVAPGTYTGDGNRDLDFKGKGVRLQSVDADQTIIDCQGTELEPHRGFYFHSGEDSNAVLSAITVENGFAPGNPYVDASVGGGILCDSSSPTIANCIIRSNTAMNAGGGIACVNGSAPRLLQSCFDNNVGDNELDAFIPGYGGGLRSDSSSPMITACVFRNNRAGIGGAISCASSNASMDSCQFIGNVAATFSGFEPWLQGAGGALHLYLSSPEIAFCTFFGNLAEPEPWMYHRGGQGGAAFMYYAAPVFSNCTFYANNARRADDANMGQGGGIFCSYSSPTLQRCIIAGSVDGEAVYCGDTASHAVLICSDIFNNAGGDWTGCIADQANIDGNFATDPLFCAASDSDLSLQDNSPCVESRTPCGMLIGAWGVGCDGTGIGTDDGEPTPVTYHLRNFPNPFNSGTQICFDLEAAGIVRIEVFDVLGRLQATLEDGVMKQGQHTVSWNGRNRAGIDLASGVYLCRIEAHGCRAIAKLTLMR